MIGFSAMATRMALWPRLHYLGGGTDIEVADDKEGIERSASAWFMRL